VDDNYINMMSDERLTLCFALRVIHIHFVQVVQQLLAGATRVHEQVLQ
jgi:hypothetical protein